MEEFTYSLYQRKESNCYYFRAVTPDGHVIRKSTNTSNEKLAHKIAEQVLGRMGFPGYGKGFQSLGSIIKLYENPKTNPRYAQAKLDGEMYGEEHAYCVSRISMQLEELIKTELPYLWDRAVRNLQRSDAKLIKDTIARVYGHRRKSQIALQIFKSMMSQCVYDDMMQVSPAGGIHDIKYEAKVRESIPDESLSWLIAQRKSFATEQEWVFFTILATTGMRRSEVLGMTNKKLFKNIYTIDQTQHSSCPDNIGLPKDHIIRIIPLSRITMEALSVIKPDKKSGRYFYERYYWVDQTFARIQSLASALDPDHKEMWMAMTPHILRHSINTNLLLDGQNPLLVAEYLAWHHQEISDIQKRYTNFIAADMGPIADAIDRLYDERVRNTIGSQQESLKFARA